MNPHYPLIPHPCLVYSGRGPLESLPRDRPGGGGGDDRVGIGLSGLSDGRKEWLIDDPGSYHEIL